MFNYRNNTFTDGDYFQSFLCYQDEEFGLKQFSELSCNFSGGLGIKDNFYQNGRIKIYPKPAHDILTISSDDNGITGSLNLSMTDLCGREVKQIYLEGLSSESIKINISDLKSGAYILTLRNGSQIIYKGKLLKGGSQF